MFALAQLSSRPRPVTSTLTRLLSVERMPFTVDAVYASPRARKLDWVALSWFEPDLDRLSRSIRRPDQQVPDPIGLRSAIESYGRPVAVVANGMCNWWPVDGRPERRADRQTRMGYVAEQLACLDGSAVKGYFHWSITDCYSFGSYSPRYGLYAVDRADDHVRVLEHDGFGDDAASCFRHLAERLRAP